MHNVARSRAGEGKVVDDATSSILQMSETWVFIELVGFVRIQEEIDRVMVAWPGVTTPPARGSLGKAVHNDWWTNTVQTTCCKRRCS